MTENLVATPQQDAGKILQDLLGLSGMANQFEQAIVGAITSPEVANVLTANFESSMHKVFVRILNDEDSRAKMAALLSSVGSSENAKGMIAEGVFSGFKRLVGDADAQKNLVAIGGSVISSQDVTNMTGRILDGFSRRLKEYFASEEFATCVKENSNGVVASMQELLNLSVKEGIEGLRGVKLTLTAGV